MAFMKTYTFQLFQSQRGLSFITRLDAGTSAFSSNNRTASLLESILWTRKSDFSRFLLSASPRLYPRHGNCIKKHHRSDPSRPDSATRPLQCVTAAIPPLLQVTSTEEMNGLYVIVGATGAIGRCLSKKIVEQGGTPLLVGRCADKLSALNEELGGSLPVVSGIDFSDPSTAGSLLSKELKDQTLQGVAYAAGSITLKSIRGAKTSDFIQSYNVNVLGAVETVKASLAGLKKSKGSTASGSIVFFSSVASKHGLSNHSVIGCSKGALEGLTRSLAAEFSPDIRVNCVAPSLTGGGSEMAKPMTENEKMAAVIAKAHPLQRLGLPEDSANAALYLLSSNSSWTTGAILPVDGGRSTILT